ncbi:MAG TPA: protein phosphatase CheZ [Alphaproteobacteria bacterium]|nr:protein phosphatase CheZ [Alphaproteobacteria bacterium]
MSSRAVARSPGASSKTAAKKLAPAVDPKEVEAIVERVLGSMEGDVSVADIKLYRELESLALYIRSAKAEIAALSPDEISSTHIPKASDELDAIVEATEEATHKIMGAAEKIEGVSTAIEGEAAETLTEAVTGIYEACSFQDITGQRITKVVKALKHIDEKVAKLVEAFGEEIHKFKRAQPAEEKKAGEAIDEKDLLNGPQLGTDAKTQAEIDALLASFD